MGRQLDLNVDGDKQAFDSWLSKQEEGVRTSYAEHSKGETPVLATWLAAQPDAVKTSFESEFKEEQKSAEDVLKDFEAWLAGQPTAVKAAYEEHLKGLKSALVKERDARVALEKKAAEADRQTQKEKEAVLQAGQKWQELAELRGNQIVELERSLAEAQTSVASVSRYEAFAKSYLDNAKKQVPNTVLPLLERLSLVEQVEYLASNPDLFKQQRLPIPGTPRPDGDGKTLTPDELRKRSFKVGTL